MKRDGGPAFARPAGWNGLNSAEEHASNEPELGMSMRDYFAGQALVECIRVAADQAPLGGEPMLSELFMKASSYAYFAADAMLAERDKPRVMDSEFPEVPSRGDR